MNFFRCNGIMSRVGASRKSGRQNRRVDFSSIGAEMSRHVGAKSQRFLDFNFSKAFLVSFLKILSSHSTKTNQSESMEDFRNLKKGNFEKKTMLKRK